MKIRKSLEIRKYLFKIDSLMYLLAFCLILSCQPGISVNENIDVYRPEKLNDGQPNIEGNFWEIAKKDQINIQQKALVEIALETFPLIDNEAPILHERVEGLGITDLNALKGVSAKKGYLKLEFYSTRLKDISVLQEFLHLQELTIRGSDVEDFSPISKLTKLKKLDISYSKSQTLNALSGLTDLTSLTIDEESNFSLEPLQSLMSKHLDSNGKMIELKVKYIKGKLKETPTSIKGNDMNGKVTPILIGKYKVLSSDYYPLDPNLYKFSTKKTIGELILKESEFYFKVNEEDTTKQSFIRSGKYRSIGNLIYFKRDNEENEYINSFIWESDLGIYFVDRVSFENTSCVSFLLRKISDEPE